MAADHPRIRGEHDVDSLDDVDFWGSSPHTRGARWAGSLANSLGRIIPAYAGSTRERDGGLMAADGSSPHTRGAHILRPPPVSARGIIPAYAGSTGTWR